MSISEDSCEGITLDNVPSSVQPEGTSGVEPLSLETLNQVGGASHVSPSQLVFYLVVNTTSAPSTNTVGSSISSEASEPVGSSIACPGSLNVIHGSTEDENKASSDDPPYTLDAHLNDVDSSHNLITSFEREAELDSVSGEIAVSNDAVLNDSFHVEDSISTQLLQPDLNEVDNDIGDSHLKDEETEPILENTANVNVAAGVSQLSGIHQLVTIGGQQFILYTGPVLQEPKEESGGITLDASALGSVVAGTSGLVTLEKDADDEPPTKRIHLETAAGDASASQHFEASLSSTHFSKEELRGMNVLELPVASASESCQNPAPLEQMHATVQLEQTTGVVEKAGKGAADMDVTQTWFTTKDDKLAFQNTGQTWKQGQWSKDEVDVLQDNIAHYCRMHNISDPADVIFKMTKEDRKNFYRQISRGLNRPLFSVYRRVVRMYDSTNHIGKYSAEELDKLRDLKQKFGADWAAIGAAMGRSPSSVKDRCRLMKDQCNSGKWLPEEEKRLTEAVQRLTGMVPGESVTTGLSWALVAEQVGTRSEKQCRTKWLNYLNWKQRGGTEWNRSDDLVLIDKIYNLGYTEENQIDWEALADNWPSARSPQWLRGKWWSLKRHVPDYQLLTFPELIKHLKANNRTIIRASDNYAVKLTAPMNISLSVPVTHETGGSLDGVSTSHQFADSGSHLNSNSNTEPNLLQTLTAQQLIEMQPSTAVKLVYTKSSDAPINVYNLPDTATSIDHPHSDTLQCDVAGPGPARHSPLQPDPASIYVNSSETLRQRSESLGQKVNDDLAVGDNVIEDQVLGVGEDAGLVLTIKQEPETLDRAAVLVQSALSQE